jgi:hypothetical protein
MQGQQVGSPVYGCHHIRWGRDIAVNHRQARIGPQQFQFAVQKLLGWPHGVSRRKSGIAQPDIRPFVIDYSYL